MSVSFVVKLFVCIDQVSVNWSGNLFSGVIVNCMWVISKPDIRIWFPHRFVEVCGYGACFFIAPVAINILIGFNAVLPVWQFLVDYWQLIYKHHIILFLLLGLYIYKHNRRFFPLLGLYIYKHHRRLLLLLGLDISAVPRGTKGHQGPLKLSLEFFWWIVGNKFVNRKEYWYFFWGCI